MSSLSRFPILTFFLVGLLLLFANEALISGLMTETPAVWQKIALPN